MSQIIELIKELRERTGAGMMDCKRALEATDLSIEAALDWLREKGITKAANKSSRIAAEGVTFIAGTTCRKVVIEVNSETDFVARNSSFISLVEKLAAQLLKTHPATIEEAKTIVAPLINEATMKIGEKIDLRRYEIIEASANQVLGSYVHFNSKFASLVLMTGATQTFADEMAMHVAAANPRYIDTSAIPHEAIEHETKIQRTLVAQDEKLKSKPEAALAKIIEGKVSKSFRDSTLSEQEYSLSEDRPLVSALLKSHGASVLKFVRYAVGEGIEKRVDNFAEEVMAQIK